MIDDDILLHSNSCEKVSKVFMKNIQKNLRKINVRDQTQKIPIVASLKRAKLISSMPRVP